MEKKPNTPKFPIKERLKESEYDRLMKFQREYFGLDKNYGKHGKRK